MPDKPTYEELELKVKRLEERAELNRQTEKALRLNEARFRTAMESLPFDLFVIDNSGCYVMQNTACKERWGDITGKRPEDITQNKDVRFILNSSLNSLFSYIGFFINGVISAFSNDEINWLDNI